MPANSLTAAAALLQPVPANDHTNAILWAVEALSYSNGVDELPQNEKIMVLNVAQQVQYARIDVLKARWPDAVAAMAPAMEPEQ